MTVDIHTLEEGSLIKIKNLLDTKFGKGQWSHFEPETIALEFESILTPLLVDKISLLRVLEISPEKVFEDPALFLYAAEVINNEVADFNNIPHLTMLEAGYAIVSIVNVLRDNEVSVTYPEAIKKTCAYILNQEGSSEPIEPFDFVDKSELKQGQTSTDTEAKKKAMAFYIKYMDAL